MNMSFKAVLFYLILISVDYCGCKDFINLAVIGDWGGLPTPPYYTDIEQGISRQLVDLATAKNVEFLLALGDNFYFDGVKNVLDPRFNSSFENVFHNKDLYFPWYFIAGNHDWRGNVTAQIEYTQYSKRWRYPDYFYGLKKEIYTDKGVLQLGILMIDTVVLCGNTLSDFSYLQPKIMVAEERFVEEKWKYIEQILDSFKKYKYILVAGHYPIWSIAEHGPTECLVNRLDPLLKKYNVSAYLNGHDHTMEHIQVELSENSVTMNYCTIGAANFCNNNIDHLHSIPPNSLKYHWINDKNLGGLAHLNVTFDKMYVEYLSTDKKILYKFDIVPRY